MHTPPASVTRTVNKIKSRPREYAMPCQKKQSSPPDRKFVVWQRSVFIKNKIYQEWDSCWYIIDMSHYTQDQSQSVSIEITFNVLLGTQLSLWCRRGQRWGGRVIWRRKDEDDGERKMVKINECWCAHGREYLYWMKAMHIAWWYARVCVCMCMCLCVSECHQANVL